MSDAVKRGWLLLSRTRPMYHALCGEEHRPGPCNDGVDRNGSLGWLVPIIDHPLLVAGGRIVVTASVVMVVVLLIVKAAS